MDDAWLDKRSLRRICTMLVGLQLLIAALNLAYIPAETREREAWASHIESPETGAAASEQLAPRTQFLRFVKQQLDLDRESNFTTWFSSMQWSVAAFAALLLFARVGHRGWLMLSLGLAYVSADELCQIHEWVGVFIANSGFRIGALEPPYPWVIALGPIFLAYAVVVLRFLHRELKPHPDLWRLGLLAIGLMALTLPLEVVGGQLQGAAPRPPRLEVIAEETLETLGGTLLLFMMLSLLMRGRAKKRGGAETDR
jgi:hypothetical protein